MKYVCKERCMTLRDVALLTYSSLLECRCQMVTESGTYFCLGENYRVLPGFETTEDEKSTLVLTNMSVWKSRANNVRSL